MSRHGWAERRWEQFRDHLLAVREDRPDAIVKAAREWILEHRSIFHPEVWERRTRARQLLELDPAHYPTERSDLTRAELERLLGGFPHGDHPGASQRHRMEDILGFYEVLAGEVLVPEADGPRCARGCDYLLDTVWALEAAEVAVRCHLCHELTALDGRSLGAAESRIATRAELEAAGSLRPRQDPHRSS